MILTRPRSRDAIQRELYSVRRRFVANAKCAESTDNKQTAALCDRLANHLAGRIAALEVELERAAPAAPTPSAQARWPQRSSLTPMISYRTSQPTAEEVAAAGDLDIPEFLRRAR